MALPAEFSWLIPIQTKFPPCSNLSRHLSCKQKFSRQQSKVPKWVSGGQCRKWLWIFAELVQFQFDLGHPTWADWKLVCLLNNLSNLRRLLRSADDLQLSRRESDPWYSGRPDLYLNKIRVRVETSNTPEQLFLLPRIQIRVDSSQPKIPKHLNGSLSTMCLCLLSEYT